MTIRRWDLLPEFGSRRDQFGFRDQFAGCDGALMPLVSGIEESHKVKPVNEGNFHGCCFGAP